MQDDLERREAIIRATLSGLGFDLVKTPRGFMVIDRLEFSLPEGRSTGTAFLMGDRSVSFLPEE